MAPRQHGDLHLMSALARRGFTMIELLIALVILTVRRQPMFGSRPGYARGDSVLVFYEGDPGTRNDDSWLRGEVKDAQAGVCVDPNGNHPAWVLTLGAQWIAGSQFNVAGAITTGSPVRGFTSTTYSLWLSPTDNQYYLAQTVNTSTQPMVGPLSGPNGLTFNYYDANGVVTADSSKVAQIEIRVRGRTQSPISQPGAAGVAYKIDSVVTRVAIRGNTRCNPCL